MKRVPTQMPSAPRDSAAASPRPSKMPPAATTGTRSPTASTIWGTSGRVATCPVWPPASVPWATTRSHPASTARTACSTLPHMLTTTTSWRWQSSTTSVGTPSPATKAVAPPSMTILTCSAHAARHGREEVDPEGLVGGRAHGGHLRHHLLVAHGGCAEAAEAARRRDGRHQFGVRDAAHAGQHDGVLDAEQLGETSSHRRSLPLCLSVVRASCSRRPPHPPRGP